MFSSISNTEHLFNNYYWDIYADGAVEGIGSQIAVEIQPTVEEWVTICLTGVTNCDSITVCQEVFVSPVQTEQQSVKSNLSLFPNPTTGLVQIDLDAKEQITKVEVFNSFGQVVLRSYVRKDEVSFVDLRHLSAGTYWLNIHLKKGGTSIERVVLIDP